MTIPERLQLAISHHRAGRSREAAKIYRQILAEHPNQIDALQMLGSLAADLGQLDESIKLLSRAIQINSNIAQYHANLGAAYARTKRFDEAAESLQRAVDLDPSMAAAYYNLGSVLLAQFEFARAIPVFQKAIALNPNWPELHNNLGLALRNEARHTEALAAFKRALTLRPDYPSAHWNLSWTLLLLGDFKSGWAEYEWRTKCPAVMTPRPFPQPQWRGEELAGRTILLHAEQGFGDMLQVVRFAPLVAKRGGKVIVECRPELATLFKTVKGIEQIIVQGQSLPPFDIQCSMMSLPLAFNTTLETIPAEVPYISATPDRIAAWQEKLGPRDGRLCVGLVWAGRPAQQYDRRRSASFEHFAQLSKVKSARFFSLQKGPAAAQAALAPPKMNLIDLTADLHDFAETAALIANLDLIIGIESAVTHLAGAMGKPVWAILAHVADWRYLLNRSDSPWYPTMRLFRQTTPGDWGNVMDQVAESLKCETV